MGNVIAPRIEKIQSEWVSEGLEDKFRDWVHYNPVMISAQTGCGKNHFIMKKLVPYALETGQQVFLLSNRVALGVQQKIELLDALGWPNRYSNDELRKMEDFGPIHVWSYQSVLTHLTHLKTMLLTNGMISPDYSRSFLVLDEAHFFLNDAPFNANTQQIFATLVHVFQPCKRIYMTATPDNILSVINESEQIYTEYRLFGNYDEVMLRKEIHFVEPITVYQFERDYSGYKISFFSDIKDLYRDLKQANSDNKWLCFINSKDRQRTIARDLNLGKKLHCFSSTGKQEKNEVWNSLLQGKILGHILLTTSVIDNGINITDSAVHNVILEASDKISLLQMLGRKRKGRDEIVNVFIQVPSQENLKQKLNSLDESLQMMNAYATDPSHFLQHQWPNLHQHIRNLFWIDAWQCLQPNWFAYREFTIRHQLYSDLLFEMQHSSEEYNVYPSIVLGWLGLPNSNEFIHWIGEDDSKRALNQLTLLLDRYMPNGVPTGEQTAFYTEFIEIASKIYYQRPTERDDSRSMVATLNRHLACLSQLLPFEYSLKKENKRIIITKSKKR